MISKEYSDDFGDISINIPLVWASCWFTQAILGPEIMYSLPIHYLEVFTYKHYIMGICDFT